MTDFEKIYDKYFKDVYLYIRRLSGSEDIAEEVTSETFYKAIQSIHTFRGDCDLRVWLCQIAKNCYFTEQKKAGREESRERQELPGDQESPEQRIIREEEAARIRRILHTIPDPYKEVFMWRVFAEMSFREIGSLFRKSENWACVTYHRARKMIRERLEEMENEE